ncbi:MAG: NADH-quinone oxidoreductase subunit N [Bacteriovoracaceae bacterium]
MNFYPEKILALLIVILFLVRKINKTFFYFVLVIGLFVVYYFTLQNSEFFKSLFIIATMATVYLSQNSREILNDFKTQFALLSLGILMGSMLLVSAQSFFAAYLALELIAIFSMVLTLTPKNEIISSEAGVKWVIYGAISSGIMLYGISHIYGLLGTTEFVHLNYLNESQRNIFLGSFLLFFVGIGFKLATVPFHMWAPDVFEATPVAANLLFAVVPKLSALVILAKITNIFFGMNSEIHTRWVTLIQFVAFITMLLGNFSAINQQSIKRMFAYAGIAQMGVLLFVYDQLFYYALLYLFSIITAYIVINFVVERFDSDNLERFNGLIKKYPVMAICLTLSLFSLITFAAPFSIISAAIQKQNYGIALITVLNLIAAMYYYLKLIGNMVFKEPETDEKIVGFNYLNQLVVVGICLPVVLLSVFCIKNIFN